LGNLRTRDGDSNCLEAAQCHTDQFCPAIEMRYLISFTTFFPPVTIVSCFHLVNLREDFNLVVYGLAFQERESTSSFSTYFQASFSRQLISHCHSGLLNHRELRKSYFRGDDSRTEEIKTSCRAQMLFKQVFIHFENAHYRELFLTESFIYWIRKNIDEMRGFNYYAHYVETKGREPDKLEIASIGKLLDSEQHSLYQLFNLHLDKLKRINEDSNTYKHSFITSESHQLFDREAPSVNCLNRKNGIMLIDLQIFIAIS
jgi:hypothetical protein